MQRILIGVVGAICLITSPAMANDLYTPLPVGTQITWLMPTDEGTQTRVSEVVANGQDFVVYKYDLTWSPDDAWGYLVEFSGLYSTSCSAQMPSIKMRQQLIKLWPLKTGAKATFAFDAESQYEVQNLTVHEISQVHGPRPAWVINKIIGDIRTKVLLSADLGFPVREEWNDGRVERVIDVFVPPRSKPALSGDQLGNCLTLLQ